MAQAQKVDYICTRVPWKHPRFLVTGRYADGRTKLLGRVEYKWFRHVRQSAWEATGADGSHRAVHEHQWQAVWALNWDGTGYPFPVATTHARDVCLLDR